MGKGKSKRHSSRSRSRDAEGGQHVPGPGKSSSTPSKLPMPLVMGILVVEMIFGLVFIILGAINVNECQIDPMIPIWLILMGIIYIITGIHEFNQLRIAKSSPNKGRGFVSIIITVIIAATTVGLFIAGNVFVYTAWGVQPDYGHTWFSNGCNKSVYMLAFIATILMDVMFSLTLIGLLFYLLFSCCSQD